jgi:hypothetical protein
MTGGDTKWGQLAHPADRLSTAGGMPKAKAYHPTLGLHAPFSVQARLLRANGSAISSIGRSGPDEKTMGPRQPLGDEVLIAFPRSADAEAVAVALRVDDVFLRLTVPAALAPLFHSSGLRGLSVPAQHPRRPVS